MADTAKVYERAIRLLARREHSVAELRRKLVRGCDDEELVTQAIAKLAADDLVSDERFVEVFVRSRIDRGHGPLKIRAGLRERGIDDIVIDDSLTYDDAFWVSRAQLAQAKRFGPEPDGDAPSDGDEGARSWLRRARFLAGRGFPSDIIYRCLGPQYD